MSESSIRDGNLYPSSEETTETRKPNKKNKKDGEREVGSIGEGVDGNHPEGEDDAPLGWDVASIGPLITQICLFCDGDMIAVISQREFWGPDWTDEIRWTCSCGFKFIVERLT